MLGCQLDTSILLKDGNILAFFPLHDIVELRILEEKWMIMCQMPWQQNVDAVKDYYGEKIALYFVWLGHYTTYLFYASIVGVLIWILVAAGGRYSFTRLDHPLLASIEVSTAVQAIIRTRQ